jgi:streptomycin 6-kinase
VSRLTPIEVPEALAVAYGRHSGAAGRAWIAALPRLAADTLDRWELRLDGPATHGMASLVLPVLLPDGTPAVLKLQLAHEDNAAAPLGLRLWNGAGVVRLLDHDPGTGAMLLERLDATRPLSAHPDEPTAVRVLAGLLARLTAVPAPEGLRHLSGIAAAMLAEVPGAVPKLRDPAERRLVRACAGAVAELLDEPGDRLLHWDLHYDNILAAHREPWLAIDPEPLAGDPGFELLPALYNRWDDIVVTGDISGAVLRRFDVLTEALCLDRACAAGWTLGRVLQDALWDIADGEPALCPARTAIAEVLLNRRSLAR